MADKLSFPGKPTNLDLTSLTSNSSSPPSTPSTPLEKFFFVKPGCSSRPNHGHSNWIQHRRFASANSSLIPASSLSNMASFEHHHGPSSLPFSTSTATLNSKRSHEEDVYEDLCYVTLRSNREKENEKPFEPVEKRDYCIKELVETEKNYCEALRMIIDHFVQPLSRVLNADHQRIIFSNLKSLADLHSKFYQELYRAFNGQCTNVSLSSNHQKNHYMSPACSMPSLPIANRPSNCSSPASSSSSTSSSSNQKSENGQFLRPPSFQNLLANNTILSGSNAHLGTNNARFSNCFLNFRDQFLIYGDYCANLPKAQELLDELCSEDELVNQWVIRCQNKANDGRFKFRDLLSLPMQRILKYHLLLAELIKNTAETNDDYQGLKRAHDALLDIGAYINEVKRDTETLEIIQNIQRCIVDLSMPDNYELKDYGRLIRDGEVRMRSHDDPRMKNRYIFIFDKVILMCKSLKGYQYSYKEAIVLDQYKIEDISTSSPISKLTGKNWSWGWSLVHTETRRPYTFFVKNEYLKRKWLEALERAQDNVRPKASANTDHQFVMTTVTPATCCSGCGKFLKGTWYQGYSCLVCDVKTHKACITSIKPCGSMVDANSSNSDLDPNTATSLRAPRPNLANLTNLPPSDCSRLVGAAPPTPSRTKRIIARANFSNVNQGELMFEQNDNLMVYANNGTSWFGRNLRTGEEGHFSPSLVTEIVSDSRASSSIDSPTVIASGSLRFSYEDGDMFHTLPRKFGSNHISTPSPQSVLIPASPLAASTPAIHNNDELFFFGTSPKQTNFTSHTQPQIPSNPALVEDANMRVFLGNGYNLEEYAWFAGSMDRETAQTTLSPLPNGSFLVRISPKQKNSYAISINYKGHVKHMRVQVTYDTGINPTTIHSTVPQYSSNLEVMSPAKPAHFFLSATRYFRTIVDLIRWYELNSLSESFNMVNTQLLLPYKKAYCHEILGYAVALYAFSGTSSAASSFLSLRKGDRVMVLSRAAEDKGWWKGQIDDRIGYFPFKYVSPTTNSLKIFCDSHQANQSTTQTSNSIIDHHHHLSLDSKPEPTVSDQPTNNDDSFSGLTTSTQMTDVSLLNQSSPTKNPVSMSPCSISSTDSSTKSSATTLSSPVNSDSISMHSQQASNDDAGLNTDVSEGFLRSSAEKSNPINYPPPQHQSMIGNEEKNRNSSQPQPQTSPSI